ncbi:MAG: nucleotidyltransferase domain-containing protein [Bacillota bacterium]|nr:nucleotidyltransferase domain-containing protein [Bacillota bacterium]
MIDITDRQRDIIINILKHYVPDREVWAFGSRVKGTAKSYSDLDLIVIGESKMTINQLGELREAFQESELPFRVDVLDWHRTSPEFRRIIGTSGTVRFVPNTM